MDKPNNDLLFEICPHPWGWYVLLNGENIARFRSREAAEAAVPRFAQQAQEYRSRIDQLKTWQMVQDCVGRSGPYMNPID